MSRTAILEGIRSNNIHLYMRQVQLVFERVFVIKIINLIRISHAKHPHPVRGRRSAAVFLPPFNLSDLMHIFTCTVMALTVSHLNDRLEPQPTSTQ
jgi:hypothetical protein